MHNNIWPLIHSYLKQENEGVLLLHLNNAGSHADDGEHYDNTEANVSQLFQELAAALRQCQQDLNNYLSTREAETVAKLLAIYTDEDVLTSGLYPRRVLWPKLQVAYIGNKEGGIIFYELLDEALKLSHINGPVLRVFSFLLSRHYKGKHHSNPLRIKQYRELLASALDEDLITGEEVYV